MKKLISISSATAVLLLPALLLAVADFSSGSVESVLANITTWLLWLLGTVVVIALIIAGFYFVFAQGKQENIDTARKFVLWALIGLAVGFLAYVLVNLVSRITGGTFTK